MNSLANKALLVSLNISQWTGRKLDKRATSTVEEKHATGQKVGNYTKKLLPQAKELDAISAQAQALREFVYNQTLPWFSDGSRILKSSAYLDFVAEFNNRKQSFDFAVTQFLKVYPILKATAQVKLGDLYREQEYPTQDQLARAFRCAIAIMPLPDVTDFRIELSDAMKADFEKNIQDAERGAMLDAWNRLHEVVTKATEKLSKPDAIFRDSLIENIMDICNVLPRLNVTDDTNLEAMRVKAEKLAASISPDTVRDNPTERANTVDALKELENQMSVFMK